MSRLRVCLIGAWWVGMCGAEASAREPSPKEEIRILCGAIDDGPATTAEEQRRQRVVAMGESGRAALLDLARSREPVRACAIDYLISMRERRVLPMLQEAFGDDKAEAWLVGRALMGLAAFGADAFVTSKVGDPVGRAIVLLQRGDWTAVYALGTVRDPRAVGELCRVLLDSKGVVFSVLQAIRSLHDERAVGCVQDLAASRPMDDIERGAVAATLATIGSPKGRRAALDLLSGFKHADERARAVATLSGILDEARQTATDPSELADIEGSLEALKLSELHSGFLPSPGESRRAGIQ